MTQTTGSTSIKLNATPAEVWEIITDLDRIGELSPECFKSEWEPGAAKLTPGARFRGTNRQGDFEWETTCMVIGAIPEEEWTFSVDAPSGPATIWRYLISPTDDGCEVTETFDSPALATDYFQKMDPPRDGQLRDNISTTLTNLKKLL